MNIHYLRLFVPSRNPIFLSWGWVVFLIAILAATLHRRILDKGPGRSTTADYSGLVPRFMKETGGECMGGVGPLDHTFSI